MCYSRENFDIAGTCLSKKSRGIEFAIVIIMIVGVAIWNISTKHSLYMPTPDGDVYISIARNFIETGHFIQTARPYESGMIIPFGLPFIYTLLYVLFGGIWGIVFSQYLLYGLSACLIYKIANRFTKQRWPALFAILLFFWSDKVLMYANPSVLLTEIWYVFFILLWVYIFTASNNNKQKGLRLTCTAFILLFIRPVFCVFAVFSVCYCIGDICKKKTIERTYILLTLVIVVILLINVSSNYRETGEFVLLENYSGVAVYEANNPNTQTDSYHSGRANEFVEDRFWQVFENKELSVGEKNKIYSSWAREYCFNNIRSVISNTKTKFDNFFIGGYGLDIYISLISIAVIIFRKKYSLLCPYGIIFIEGVITSMGLFIERYGVFIAPMYIILKIIFLAETMNFIVWLSKKLKSNKRIDRGGDSCRSREELSIEHKE